MSEGIQESNLKVEVAPPVIVNDEAACPTEEPTDDENTFVIDIDSEELDLNHHRLTKIQDFEQLTKVKKLCLRWNLIKKIENLSTLTTLTELELYDNQITEIENLETLTNLQ